MTSHSNLLFVSQHFALKITFRICPDAKFVLSVIVNAASGTFLAVQHHSLVPRRLLEHELQRGKITSVGPRKNQSSLASVA